MDRRWDEFEAALRSGDATRVNAVIDEVNEMDIGERAAAFDDCFDGMTALYAESDDGYVRQSCVRLADELAPGFAAAVNYQDEQVDSDVGSAIHDQTDALCGFFLDALTDEDGRVRQSAQQGLQGVVRAYDALEDGETVEAVIAEPEEMAAEYSGKRREHLLDAKEDAEFALGSGLGRMVREVREQLNE